MDVQVFRTMIVPDVYAQLARDITSALAPSGGANMFNTGLSEDGSAPATHWVSSGFIDEQFANLMPLDGAGGQPEAIAYLCEQAGMTVAVQEVENLLSAVDVTTEGPFVAMSRLGVQIVNEEVEP